MYTERYVRRMKFAHTKLLDKFAMGTKFALKAQEKQTMCRAARLVVDCNNKLLMTFQEEA